MCDPSEKTFLNSPSGFAVLGDLLVVAELYSRLAVVDAEDHFVGYVGASDIAQTGLGWPERPGWPNALSDDERACMRIYPFTCIQLTALVWPQTRTAISMSRNG